MVGEWGTYALTDLYSVSSGLSKPAKDFGEGHPFVSFKDVFYNFFLPDELSQLVRSNEKEQEKCSVRRGDVFLTRTSETMEDLGMSCVSRKDYPSATFNGFCKRLRPSTDLQVHPEYVGYYLRTPQFRNEMLAFSTMSTRASLNNDMIGRLQITLPPLPEQKAIAHVLGSLDDKIELNRRMNETLEGMAQALFKSWFVDFDPVIDNALAAGNPIPEPLAQRAETRRQAIANGTANRETAQAFPASFRFTEELGWIPEGWEVKELRNYSSTISKGTTPRKKDVENADDQATVPFIKVRDITDGGELIEVGLDKIPRSIHQGALKRSMLQSGDILFSIAGTIGRVTILPESLNDSNSNQAIAFIRPENASESNFLLEHLKGEFVQNRIHSRIVQAVQANVSLTELGDIPTITPIREIMKKWSDYTDPIYRQVIKFRTESQTLARLRDVLLPKLISGELRIPQAEKMVEEAIA